MTLFVSGASELSGRAIESVRRFGEAQLPGEYELSVVDVHQNPELLAGTGVLAAPTLVLERPLPRRLLVGDLADVDRLRAAFGLPQPGAREPRTDARG